MDGQMIDCDIIFKSALASLNEEFATVIESKDLFNLLT
jgi:hypothetical protein